MRSELAGDIATVRSFSRFYTRILGLLDAGLLDTPYSLIEARIIYELAQNDATEVTALRQTLGVDGGYLSRLLARLEGRGVLERTRSTGDARRLVVTLTKAGRDEFTTLDERSRQQVAGLLGDLDADDRRRLVGAMQAIEHILGDADEPEMVVLRPADSGDFGWIVERHGALYRQEYGWDPSFEALVARVVADYVDAAAKDPAGNAAWIAEVDGTRVGCVLCVRKNKTTAQLRLLLVDPAARKSGIGGRLVDECMRFARRAGYRRMVLWTNDVLVAARRIYERAGFTLVDEDPHHSFGHDLVGQNWALDLD
jgi:DNA-binding MarR family transcriptional regulator/GNAT superfamily N-acetyltransferase